MEELEDEGVWGERGDDVFFPLGISCRLRQSQPGVFLGGMMRSLDDIIQQRCAKGQLHIP